MRVYKKTKEYIKPTSDSIQLLFNSQKMKHPKIWGFFLLILFPLKLLLILIFYLIWKPLELVLAIFRKIITDPMYWGFIFAPLFTLLYKFLIDYSLTEWLFPNGFANDSITIQSYVEWLGILYGFLISMIFVRAWERADGVTSSLAREAQAVAILIDNVQSISAKSPIGVVASRNRIIRGIKGYVDHAENLYSIEHADVNQKLVGDKKLDEIGREIKINFESRKKYAFLKLNQNIREIIDARDERIQISKLRIPNVIWMLLLVSSFLWLILFLFIRFDNNWIGYALVFGVAFIVITTITTILVFNEPTRIEWNDPSGSWKRLKSKVLSNS